MKRLIERLAKPLRLLYIDWQKRQSRAELERLYDMRDDAHRLAAAEHQNQVRLEMRRNQIMRGRA